MTKCVLVSADTAWTNAATSFIRAQGDESSFPLRAAGVYAGRFAQLQFTRCSFSGSWNAGAGGIFFAQPGSAVTLIGSALSGGGSLSSGGALFMSADTTSGYSSVVLIDTTVTDCSAAASGGAFYLQAHASLLALSTPEGARSGAACAISRNGVDLTAGMGGAVFLERTAHFWAHGCALEANYAFRGGAVWVAGGSTGDNAVSAPSGLAPLPESLLAGLGGDPLWRNESWSDQYNTLYTAALAAAGVQNALFWADGVTWEARETKNHHYVCIRPSIAAPDRPAPLF